MPEDIDALKRAAAEKAVEQVASGMVVGLGTGSTARLAVDAIGRRVANEGLKVVGIPTSEATAAQARSLSIPLTDFATHPQIDVTIDGADSVDPKTLVLIKGLGGALLREKIVASASKRMIAVVDETKIAPSFDGRPLPVEIVRFGWQATRRKMAGLGGEMTLRVGADGSPFVTDGGNLIIDCKFRGIGDWPALHEALKSIVGVVETGLFIDIASEVIVASPDGVKTIRRG